PVHAASAAVAELAQAADRFHPAKDFFDALPRALADCVPGMAGGSAIERPAVLLHGDVRCGLKGAEHLHETARVVAFVAADRHTSARQRGDETRRRVAFTGARGRHDARIDDEA